MDSERYPREEAGERSGSRAAWLIFLALLLIPLSTVRAEQSIQVRTLDELIRMFDSSGCRECHQKVYEQWEKSHHARPLVGLDDHVLMSTQLRNGPLALPNPEKATKSNFPCFKCHLPQFQYATDGVAAEIARAILNGDKATLRKLNIGCLVCHNQKAVVHGRPEKEVLYGNKDLPEHEGYVVKRSPFLKDPLMCGQCHGLGPNLEFEHPVQCATLYGSYLHAYIPSGGSQTCQDCHMKGKNHYMPPNFHNRDEASDRLRKSLPMDVEILTYTFEPKEGQSMPMVVLKTRVTSKAGHRVPDG